MELDLRSLFDLGFATEFRSEKIPLKRIGMVSVITRKKVLIPRHSEVHGRVHSEARNRTVIRRKNKYFKKANHLTKRLFRLFRLSRIISLYEIQCGGSGMFIPDPGSDFIPSRIRTVSIPDPGSSSKNLSILTPKKQKNGFYALKNMIKKAPNPGSATLRKLQPYLGFMCTAVLIGWYLAPPPSPRIWAHIWGRYCSAKIDDISLWPFDLKYEISEILMSNKNWCWQRPANIVLRNFIILCQTSERQNHWSLLNCWPDSATDGVGLESSGHPACALINLQGKYNLGSAAHQRTKVRQHGKATWRISEHFGAEEVPCCSVVRRAEDP